MLSSLISKRLNPFLYPIAFQVKKIEPMVVTLSSVVFSFIGAILIYYNHYLLAFAMFSLSFLFDIVDDISAKINKRVTRVYRYFDEVTDRINEFMMLFPLAFKGYSFEAFFALSLSYLFSFSFAEAKSILSVKKLPCCVFGEREDRMALLLLMFLVISFYPSVFGIRLVSIFLYFIGVLALIGTIKVVINTVRFINNRDKS